MKKILLMTALTLATMPAWSSVNIHSADNIRVLAINDQDIKGNFFKAQKSVYKIDAGEAMLYVRYEQFFDDVNSDDHEIVKSVSVRLQTPVLEDGKNYYLTVGSAPQDLAKARHYAKQPTIQLYNEAGQMIAQQIGANSKTQTKISGEAFSRTYDLTKEKIKNTFVKTPVTVLAESEEKQKTVASEVKPVSPTTQQLQQLWKQASADERQQFLQWLNQVQ